MFDSRNFTDDQKEFLRGLISDLQSEGNTQGLLQIIEAMLTELAPDWQSKPKRLSAELRAEVEVCMKALEYSEIQDLAG